MTEEVLENVVEEQQKESVRPDYIPESYWVDGQVDVKKMASDLESSNKQVKDLRRIISQPKQNEQYDSLFDGRELSEAQKADMSFYVKLANKNGLSRKQAEQLYDDVSQVMQENQQKLYEEALQMAKNWEKPKCPSRAEKNN